MAGREVQPSGRVTSVEGISLVPLTALTAEAERPNKTFIGGILFNKGNNLLVVGNQSDKLITVQFDPNRQQNILTAIKDTKRLVTLNSFSDVAVRQVGLEAVDTQRPDSLQRHAPLSITFPARDPSTDQLETRVIDEEDLFSLAIGERNGIAYFSGNGFPDETGLLFESKFGGDKRAVIFFMHPEHEAGISSVDGLERFLKQINDVYAQDTDIREQQEALRLLEGYEKNEKINYGSHPVRREIFRLLLIAHARNAAQGNREEDVKLKELVPGMRRLVPDSYTPRGFNNTVNTNIANTIFDSGNPLLSEDPLGRKEREIEVYGGKRKKSPHLGRRLRTERGRELMVLYRKADFNEGSNDMQRRFELFQQSVSWIDQATTSQELDDILRITTRMIRRLRFNGQENIPDPEGNMHNATEYKFMISRQVSEKRRELQQKI